VAAVNGALNHSPLLLVTTGGLPNTVTTWLGTNPLGSVTAYGGTTRISDAALSTVATITSLPLS
jgi:hypothetical protein